MKKNLIVILALFIFSVPVFSQQATKTGEIAGRVVSSIAGEPLVRVTVRIVGLPLGGYTDEDGKFLIRNVPVGVHAVRFSYVGYSEIVVPDIMVRPTKIESLEIKMKESFIQSEEIVVRASYFEQKIDAATSTQNLSSEDIAKTPGVQEDVMRAVQLLPGVNISSGGRNDLVVRGGAPFENLYIVDDIKVPNINHFGSQGSSGGPVSIINIDYVDDVEFSAGGFGARYGDKLSSMTNITMRKGNSEQFRGRLDLSATGVDASVEGPVGENSSYFVSARRSYLDFLFSVFGFSFIPQYWDFNMKYDWKINDNNFLSVIGFGVIDKVTVNNDTQEKINDNASVAIPEQNQYVFGATWKHLFKNGYSKLIFSRTYTNFKTVQNDSSLNTIFKNYSREAEIGLKAETDFKIADNLDLITGNLFEIGTLNDYDILIPGYLRLDQNGIPNELQIDTNFRTIKNGTYATLSAAMKKWRLTAGVRADYYNMTKENWHVSPRVAAFYYLNQNMSLTASLGRYYQSPQSIWLVGESAEKLSAMRADQVVLGWSHTPMEEVKVQVEGFYKIYANYPARVYRPQAVLAPAGFDDVTGDIPYGLEPLLSVGDGTSRGIEVFIQKKLSKIPIWGLMSFTYSETRFTSIDGVERAGSYDSRIIGNLSVGYKFNNNWEFSGKFRFSTGVPTTPFNDNGKLDFTQYNEGDRLPSNHQLDVRVDKKWFLKSSMLTTYIDIQNVYNKGNVFNQRYDYELRKGVNNEGFGILPSIGVSFEF